MRRRVRHSSCMLACVLMAVFVATDATTGTLRQSVSATAGTSTAGTSTAGTSTAGTSSAEASSSLRDAVALPVPHATDEHVRGRALAATPVAPTTTQLVARYTRYSEGEASAAKLAPSGVGVGAGDARRGRGLHHRNTLRHMRFAAAHAGGGQLQQLDARGTTAGPFSMLSKLMGRFRKSRKPAAKACPGKPACSGHGSCDSNTGKCSCFTNWAGPMCKDDPLSASFITVDCTNMTTALTDACTRETGVGGSCDAYRLASKWICNSTCLMMVGQSCEVQSRTAYCNDKAMCTGLCFAMFEAVCEPHGSGSGAAGGAAGSDGADGAAEVTPESGAEQSRRRRRRRR